MGLRVGVDIGGSFTDFAVLDEKDNSVRTLKVLSRPDKPGAEVTEGLSILAKRDGINPADIGYFTHGTTVGINAVIQRKGVKLALLATRGFEDVLEVARLKITPIHNLYGRRPEPLIPRDRVFAIDERMDRDGQVARPVEAESVAAALAEVRRHGCDAVVISFLHSYRNGANERAVKALLAELAPGLPVFCSSEIWPIIREYERTITAVISGYVQPRVDHYLTSFEKALAEMGVPAAPRITKSNGGVMGVAQARAECVQMVLSGTASGVIGASYVAARCGMPRVLSLDIGGTSADVAVIMEGQPQYGTGEVVGEFQIHIPSVSVTSIGQGGGSIAWVDHHGVLKVGPDSAGSNPGPACYGRGGQNATITDAYAAVGLIGHGQLGYNSIHVDRDKATAAIGKLAERVGMSVFETAENIMRIANSEMYADVSALLSRFGIDPREFQFLAFGGAGPMMACYLARELNMQGVVIPPTPGVLSALGGLIADLKNDFIHTVYREVDASVAPVLREAFSELKERALHWLHGEQAFDGEHSLSFTADLRYLGQSFEIETRLEPDWIAQGDVQAVVSAFHREHERLFGHSDATATVQLINLRLVIAGATPKPVLRELPLATGAAEPVGQIEAYVDGAMRPMPVYHRTALCAGHRFDGPAVVMQDDCTTCVLPGMTVEVDRWGNLIISFIPS
ncbi:hydantoinase/oxoprolinase family protein [Ottowia thiooxydans]|uniref:hydantoinase/oxoprolinase family protein n=1 Tax=Ottowia thiooxydans TaxID=219182 RepID=UPI00040BBD90|nr:hydantoinase/oxoprolinase family protein [Ottowia thiooxydans]